MKSLVRPCARVMAQVKGNCALRAVSRSVCCPDAASQFMECCADACFELNSWGAVAAGQKQQLGSGSTGCAQ
eukprot:9454369-Alexandrium_andersonii.AAC.1